MKKYFVTSDIHNYYSEFIQALKEKEFDINNSSHVLIICGDLFDRGPEAKQLADFLLTLPKSRRILIKGNHDDLMLECLEELKNKSGVSWHHISNGTLDTIAQFTNANAFNLRCGDYDYADIKKAMKPFFDLYKTALDYYELDNYIFVHSWIPLDKNDKYKEDWRETTPEEWKLARWGNPFKYWANDTNKTGKTLVFGHWHCSYYYELKYKKKCFPSPNEENWQKSFETIVDEDRGGIIALDACTSYSKFVNIYVLGK